MADVNQYLMSRQHQRVRTMQSPYYQLGQAISPERNEEMERYKAGEPKLPEINKFWSGRLGSAGERFNNWLITRLGEVQAGARGESALPTPEEPGAVSKPSTVTATSAPQVQKPLTSSDRAMAVSNSAMAKITGRSNVGVDVTLGNTLFKNVSPAFARTAGVNITPEQAGVANTITANREQAIMAGREALNKSAMPTPQTSSVGPGSPALVPTNMFTATRPLVFSGPGGSFSGPPGSIASREAERFAAYPPTLQQITNVPAPM